MNYSKFVLQYKTVTIGGAVVASLLMSIFYGLDGLIFRIIVFEAVFSVFIVVFTLFVVRKLSIVLLLVSLVLSALAWFLASQIG